MSNIGHHPEEAKQPKEYLEGFAEFSRFVASDDTLSVYRRFGVLGARNCLYLQAELQFLEQQLEDSDTADLALLRPSAQENKERKLLDDAARSWESFTYQAQEGNERQKTKIRLILRIREVTKEYGTLPSSRISST